MSRVEAVIADFGGVLTTPLFNAFAGIQEAHGLSMEALGKAMLRLTTERGENPLFPLERGELAESEFLRLLEEAIRAETGAEFSMRDFAERYFAQLEPNERFIAYLRDLRAAGTRLALLTNNVAEWEPRWRPVWPIDELFETVVDSGFVGMRKPERGIYELTLARLDLPAEACAFVDDLEVNCDAAREIGLHAVRFVDTDQAIGELDGLLGRG